MTREPAAPYVEPKLPLAIYTPRANLPMVNSKEVTAAPTQTYFQAILASGMKL